MPGVDLLRGTGSTLTSYVYDNSPAGEGAAPQKAYAAAFVLLVFVLALNLLVDRIGRRQAALDGARPARRRGRVARGPANVRACVLYKRLASALTSVLRWRKSTTNLMEKLAMSPEEALLERPASDADGELHSPAAVPARPAPAPAREQTAFAAPIAAAGSTAASTVTERAAGAHDRARPRPGARRAAAGARGCAGRRPRRGPERLRLEDVSIAYGSKPAVKSVSLSIHQGEVLALIGPSGLRQDDAAAHAQPPHRADAERGARGADPARRRGHPRARRHDAARARRDGLPAAQPVPDVDLRQRRLRAARTVAQAPAPARARAARDRRAAPRRPLRGGRATTSTGPRCASPAASSSACASRARSRRGPRCC